jgi:hypothetical protein
VKLNEPGGRKLRETTARMRHGQDRLAIIIDGRLVSAPIIQATLGSSFVISGLKDLDARELNELAGKMSGRSTDPDGKVLVPEPPAPKIEKVPFTQQEYQQNKEMRERMGIFHIEAIPSKEELDQILRKGMSHAEVLEELGRPSLGRRESSTLKAILPEVDLSADDADLALICYPSWPCSRITHLTVPKTPLWTPTAISSGRFPTTSEKSRHYGRRQREERSASAIWKISSLPIFLKGNSSRSRTERQ